MITSVQALAAAAAQNVPGYCTSGHGILSPQQWQTCAKLGWNQSTSGAATAGSYAGHNIAPILIVLLILLGIIALTRRGRSASPATSK